MSKRSTITRDNAIRDDFGQYRSIWYIAFASAAGIVTLALYGHIELAVTVGAIALIAILAVIAVTVFDSGAFSYHVERKTVYHNQSTKPQVMQPAIEAPIIPTARIDHEVIDADYTEVQPATRIEHRPAPTFQQIRDQRRRLAHARE